MSTTTTIESFDKIAAKYSGENANATALARTKIKKEAELAGQVSKAKIAVMDAQEALDKAVITDGQDIATAAANLEKAERSFNFYEELYSKVFPNA